MGRDQIPVPKCRNIQQKQTPNMQKKKLHKIGAFVSFLAVLVSTIGSLNIQDPFPQFRSQRFPQIIRCRPENVQKNGRSFPVFFDWYKCLLGQWLNFKLFGITYLVGKIKFKLFFQGPLAEWECMYIFIIYIFLNVSIHAHTHRYKYMMYLYICIYL